MIRLGWILCLLLALSARADIALVADGHTPALISLQTATNQRLAELGSARSVSLINRVPDDTFKLAVYVGAEAYRRFPPAPEFPSLGIYFSRAQFPHDRFISGIYLEPPLARQVRLAQLIMGPGSSFGALSEQSVPLPDDVSLEVVAPQGESGFTRALLGILSRHDAVVGVFGSPWYQADHIKALLITAYRHNRPLIGPSRAYLRAGALASTYSSTEDVARRLAELIVYYEAQGEWPEPDYNPYFQVAFNEQVGRSLNLPLPDAEQTAEQLSEAEQLTEAERGHDQTGRGGQNPAPTSGRKTPIQALVPFSGQEGRP